MKDDFPQWASVYEQKACQEIGRMIRRFKEVYPSLMMVYLPNASPERKVGNILVAMEPSMKVWAKNPGEKENEDAGKAKVDAGFRNFLLTVEDMILQFCAGNYLVGGYHITDVSKIATMPNDARTIREQAWSGQKGLLIEELALFGNNDCRIIPLGKKAGEWVEENLHGHAVLGNERVCECTLHHSPAGRGHRGKAATNDKDGYRKFIDDWKQEDFVWYARQCLDRMKNCESVKTSLLEKLSVPFTRGGSYMNLAFTYKVDFEKISGERIPVPFGNG